MVLKARVYVYTSLPYCSLVFPEFLPRLLTLSLSPLLFYSLHCFFFFFLSLFKHILIAGTQVKTSWSWSGFSMCITLPHPYSIFASLWCHRAVTQSFILVSGFGLFIRKERKLKTKRTPLETLSLQLLRPVSSLDDPQTLHLSFSGLGFLCTIHVTSGMAGVSLFPHQQGFGTEMLHSGTWGLDPSCSILSAHYFVLGALQHPQLALQGPLPRPWIRTAPVWDLLNLKNSRTPQEHLITFALRAM